MVISVLLIASDSDVSIYKFDEKDTNRVISLSEIKPIGLSTSVAHFLSFGIIQHYISELLFL